MTASYRIELTRDALRALAKLDKPVRRRIQTAIDKLADDPRPAGTIALRGHSGAFRVRTGDYRIVYVIHNDRLLVVEVEVEKIGVVRMSIVNRSGLDRR